MDGEWGGGGGELGAVAFVDFELEEGVVDVFDSAEERLFVGAGNSGAVGLEG